MSKCFNCGDGDRQYYWSTDDGRCKLCDRVMDSYADSVRSEIIEYRLTELRDVLRLYQRQLTLGDSFRGFNLDRARSLLDEIAEIETVTPDRFQRKSKKGKVNSKVE